MFLPHMLNVAPIGKKHKAAKPKPLTGIAIKSKYGNKKRITAHILHRHTIHQIIGDKSIATIRSRTNHSTPKPDGDESILNLYPKNEVATNP